MDTRLQLIEIATMRPQDIVRFYNEHLFYVDGCSFLSQDAPKQIELLYKGKLVHYDAARVPFWLAGVNPAGARSCGMNDCLNPTHVI
jgi:hypothetical protein